MRFDMIVKGGSVVTPGEGVMRADVAVRGGKVAALIDDASGAEADDVYDASGLHVFPGVVDPHVHIGLAEGLDDWETETRSAAVGGVTTALTYLMAGTSYGPIVEANLDRAARDSVVDYGFHLVPSAPVHLDEMDEHAERYGIKSYKYFTSFRGDEGAYLGISGTDDGFMYRYFDQVAKLPGGVANVHPENIEVVWELRKRLLAEGRDDLKAWDESRPDFVEAQSAVAAAFYAHVTGCPLYIVHVSGRLALDELRAARERYGAAPLYIETCPHFLTHHSGMEIGPLGKVNPPLRSEDDEEALWDGLARRHRRHRGLRPRRPQEGEERGQHLDVQRRLPRKRDDPPHPAQRGLPPARPFSRTHRRADQRQSRPHLPPLSPEGNHRRGVGRRLRHRRSRPRTGSHPRLPAEQRRLLPPRRLAADGLAGRHDSRWEAHGGARQACGPAGRGRLRPLRLAPRLRAIKKEAALWRSNRPSS